MAHDGASGNTNATAAHRRRPLDPAARRAALDELVERRTRLEPHEIVLLGLVFPDIYATYSKRVFAQVHRWRIRDAEDVVQESFATLERFIRESETGFPESIPAILWRITHGLLRNHVRDAARNPVSFGHPISESASPSGPGVESATGRREICEKAMARLDEGQRDVVEAIILDRLSHTEAALALEIPLGTLKSRIRAAQHLLAGMAEELVPASSGRAA
jgi:RNA polymerase sigma-70 factor (ECF subfamily)